MHPKSNELRVLLADVGIQIDDRRHKPVPAPPWRASSDEVDRDAVREILIAAGAPAHDVEWLTQSCPSIEAASRYVPPPDRSV